MMQNILLFNFKNTVLIINCYMWTVVTIAVFSLKCVTLLQSVAGLYACVYLLPREQPKWC